MTHIIEKSTGVLASAQAGVGNFGVSHITFALHSKFFKSRPTLHPSSKNMHLI